MAGKGKYERKDHFYQKAKDEGYRSRAAFKLLELQKKYRLFSSGQKVVDLGCFPGGWLQVAVTHVGPKGKVIGIDLKEVEPFSAAEGVLEIVQADFTEEAVRSDLKNRVAGSFDVILSDMSPKLTGIRFADTARAAELVELAFTFASETLKPEGTLVAKIFPGPECEALVAATRPRFASVNLVNLDSSRKSSNEIYIVARGFRSN